MLSSRVSREVCLPGPEWLLPGSLSRRDPPLHRLPGVTAEDTTGRMCGQVVSRNLWNLSELVCPLSGGAAMCGHVTHASSRQCLPRTRGFLCPGCAQGLQHSLLLQKGKAAQLRELLGATTSGQHLD